MAARPVFFSRVRTCLLSDEHFTVDGTLIEATASLKSFKPKDGSLFPFGSALISKR